MGGAPRAFAQRLAEPCFDKLSIPSAALKRIWPIALSKSGKNLGFSETSHWEYVKTIPTHSLEGGFHGVQYLRWFGNNVARIYQK